MPKIVDHHQQKVKIAEAMWELIREHGMEQASIRNVAERAGLSVGALRHYFPSQSELYVYAMNLVSDRVTKRMERLDWNGPPLQTIKNALLEIVPVNDEYCAETEVWLAFVAKALSDPDLRAESSRVYDQLRTGIGRIVAAMVGLGLADADLDVELEAERLFAVVDGLALHAVQRKDLVTAEMMERVIVRHLRSLCIQP